MSLSINESVNALGNGPGKARQRTAGTAMPGNILERDFDIPAVPLSDVASGLHNEIFKASLKTGT